MELLFESDYLLIFYSVDNNWMYCRWIGDQTEQTVRDGCAKMLEFVNERQLVKILNDNRDVSSSWLGAAEWVGTFWFPAILSAGVKYFAWIYSPFVFSQLSTNTSISYAKSSPDIATFQEQQEAEEWLLSKS